jgi:hypothetical protein
MFRERDQSLDFTRWQLPRLHFPREPQPRQSRLPTCGVLLLKPVRAVDLLNMVECKMVEGATAGHTPRIQLRE